MRPILVTAATNEQLPLTLDAAKEHLRVDEGHEDAMIQQLVRAAYEAVCVATGRRLATEVWTWQTSRRDIARDRSRQLPVAPLSRIDSITYVDASGDAQTLASDRYRLIADPERPAVTMMEGDWWPDASRREDAYTVAMTTADTCPEPLVTAMKMLVGHYYANREAVVTGVNASELPLSVQSLCQMYQLGWVA